MSHSKQPRTQGPAMEFVTGARASVAKLAGDLAAALNLERTAEVTHELTVTDSFDHRIHRAGYALLIGAGDAPVAELRRLGATQPTATRPCTALTTSRFAEDLPIGRIHDLIAPLLSMRAVFPQVGAHVKRVSLARVNKHGKVEARVAVERITVWPTRTGMKGESGGRRHLPVRVRVIALRGYDQIAAKLAKRVGKWEALEPATSDWVVDAYRSSETALASYSSRPTIKVSDEERADVAVKRALSAIYDIMVENIPGLEADLDSEFLHDFRVAVRRSRAVLRFVKGVLPPAQVEYFAKELRHVGQLTSSPRDNDVLMLHIDQYLMGISGREPTSVTALKGHLQRERDVSQAELVTALRSKRFRAFQKRWAHFLGKGVPARPSAERARSPIGEVIRRETWRAYRRARRQGDAITTKSPAEDLHALRKACKRLRYLLGLFRSLYSPRLSRKVIQDLKILQDLLGTFQDLEAHALMIAARGDELRANPEAPTDTLLLMGGLVDLLTAEQGRTRDRFVATYSEFCKPEKEERIRRICHRPPHAKRQRRRRR